MTGAVADARHGFERLYWLNGHGGNIATINAAFSEIYHGISFGKDQPAGSNRPPVRCMLRNWWELPGMGELCRQLFPVGEGSHATPSEVSVTYFGYPEAQKKVEMSLHRADGTDLRRGRLSPEIPRRTHWVGSFAGQRRGGGQDRCQRGEIGDRGIPDVCEVVRSQSCFGIR